MLPRKSSDTVYDPSGRARSGLTSFEYLLRILDYRQMDFEASFDQMKTLASSNPARVYKTSYYRKQMKGQWARDDPAFAVMQAMLLVVAAFAYSVVLHFSDLGLVFIIATICRTVFLDWLLFGVAAATLGWSLANLYLRQTQGPLPQDERVEWFYAFDIHCNSFVPLFFLVHVVQFCLLPLLNAESSLAALFANLLYAVAFCAYFYITHLGYRALPFLTKTELYLYPIGAVGLLFLGSLVLLPFGIRINATRACLALHFG